MSLSTRRAQPFSWLTTFTGVLAVMGAACDRFAPFSVTKIPPKYVAPPQLPIRIK